MAMVWPKRRHGPHAPREDQAEAASQEGAQTRRSRVQEARAIAAGAAHLSKHRDVLRPGDITTDYAASARWMGLATIEPRANSGEDAARNRALCR